MEHSKSFDLKIDIRISKHFQNDQINMSGNSKTYPNLINIQQYIFILLKLGKNDD